MAARLTPTKLGMGWSPPFRFAKPNSESGVFWATTILYSNKQILAIRQIEIKGSSSNRLKKERMTDSEVKPKYKWRQASTT